MVIIGFLKINFIHFIQSTLYSIFPAQRFSLAIYNMTPIILWHTSRSYTFHFATKSFLTQSLSSYIPKY